MEKNTGNIIRELLHAKGSISAQELAERLSVSVSSVKRSLGFVRDFLNEYGVVLNSSPQKGFSIEASEEQLDELEDALLWHMNHDEYSEGYRRDYIFQTLFLYQDTYTLQLFAEELYVSRNVITKDLKEINDFLKPFHVTVEVKKNRGIVVNGHEFEIRQALTVYNNQKWWKEEYLEPPEQLDMRLSRRAWTYFTTFYPEGSEEIWEIQDILLKMEEATGNEFTDIALGRLMEYLLLTRRRWKMNRKITEYYPEEIPEIPKKYLDAAEIFIRDLMKPDDSSWEYEQVYLAARLYVAQTVQLQGREYGYREAIIQYLEEVRNTIGRYFNPMDEELIRNIEDMMVSLRYSTKYRIYDWTDLKNGIKEKYAGLYAICMMYINRLERDTELTFHEDDIAKIVLLIHNYLKKNGREAIFVTASSEEVSYFNLRRLKEEFPYINFKGVVRWKEFNLEDYPNEIIISTVVLKKMNPQVICITKHVNDDDIEIVKEYLGVKIDRQIDVLYKVFQEDLIFDMVAKNKEDALVKLASKLEQLGYVGDGFFDSLMKREKMMTTSIGSGVAIPHVYKTGVNKSFISVVRLKNSVKWSKDEHVDIIFLFAMATERVEDITKIFAHAYHILKEDNVIQRIREASDKKKIYRLVLECEYGMHL